MAFFNRRSGELDYGVQRFEALGIGSHFAILPGP
jgi:hypothetical protein